MCHVRVSDEKPHVMRFTLIDFLMVLEPDFEPYFSVFMVYELVCAHELVIILEKKRGRVEQRLEDVHVIEVLLEVRLESEVRFSCVLLVKNLQCLVMFHDSEVQNAEGSVSVIGETVVTLFDLASTVTTIT